MKPLSKPRFDETTSHLTVLLRNNSQVIGYGRVHAMKQRGVVLFFTLIALLAMSLAAVALIRSVDTSTMIAGNLAFKQSATSSGDAGVEAAMTWLAATQLANSTINVLTDPTHPFNNDNLPAGYYSSLNPALSLTDGTGVQWDNTDSVLVGTDGSGNTIRYIIQRVCLTANTLPGTQAQPLAVPPKTACLFSKAIDDPNPQHLLLPQEVCKGACPQAGQTPQIRITARATGPKNTVSYVQSFVY
jgi:Tfp pilus assembly protein PilX